MPRLACSAGVFFGRANVFARESAMLKLFLLSPIFHRHKIEDGGCNNTNTNNVSPTQNTPALQAMPLRWSQCTFKRCYVTDIVEHFNQLFVAFLFVMEMECKKTATSLLDSRNLITLINDDSSESRNLNTAKYFYSKFAKLKSRENKW